MDSIVTTCKDICAISGREATEEHHLVFGRGYRQLAEEDGLKIPINSTFHKLSKYAIHDNPTAEALSKMCGQLAFEKHWVAKGDTEDEARERFRKRYGRSWL